MGPLREDFTVNIEDFKEAVERNWRYHARSHSLLWRTQEEGGEWKIEVAPVFQEVYGGDDDGKRVWAGFLFDTGDFSREEGVWVQEQAVASYCQECTDYPKLMLKGKYRGHQFMLHLFLEPIAGTEPVELIDTIKNEVRELRETQQ